VYKRQTIFGYAIRYDEVAYEEVIRAGACTKTLEEQDDIKCYWNHDSSKPLGRQSNGALTLRQDSEGLFMEVTPNLDTSWGRDALASVQRQDVKGMSFGFRVVEGAWIRCNDEDVYEIKELALREVSPCTDPWYEATDASTRQNTNNPKPSCDDDEGEERESSSEDETTSNADPSAITLEAGAHAARLRTAKTKLKGYKP
jgi:HK97 family phage prohead protease